MTNINPEKVLLAMPDGQARHSMASAMSRAGLAVTLASSAGEVIDLAGSLGPDLVVVDEALPPTGAVSLCTALRENPNLATTRLVVLGDGESRTSERAMGDAGVDARLSRRLDAASLLTRLRDVERRAEAHPRRGVLRAGSIEMVPEQWVVSVDRKPVQLTHIEYRLLRELMQVRGRVLTRETLMERVWGHSRTEKPETRTLDVHMSRLRNKLRSASESIITVRNVGYRIDVFAEWLGP